MDAGSLTSSCPGRDEPAPVPKKAPLTAAYIVPEADVD